MEQDQKLQERAVKTDSKFLRWLDNYWYHYKWVTIVVSFFLIVGIICTAQMCSAEEPDSCVLYAGPYLMDSTQAENFRQVMCNILPRDFDGNGKKHVTLSHYQIYSEAQILAAEAQTDWSGVSGSINRNLNSTNFNTYYNYIQGGDVAVLFLDPSLYSSLRETNRLRPLAEVLDNTAQTDDSGYGIRLGDTALYRSYGSVRVLPADTVICFLRQPLVGKIRKDNYYAQEIEMLNAIVSYGEATVN